MSRARTETAKNSNGASLTAGLAKLGDLTAADACGHFGLRIAHDGTWFYHGSPIGRKAITKLFASVLRREDDGTYWLVTPAERGRIDVDDAPFIAVALDVAVEQGRPRLNFTTNLDDEVTAGPEHRLWINSRNHIYEGDGGVPYLHVRAGLNARLSRSVYYQLAELAVEEQTERGPVLGVWSAGTFFPLQSGEAEGYGDER